MFFEGSSWQRLCGWREMAASEKMVVPPATAVRHCTLKEAKRQGVVAGSGSAAAPALQDGRK